jgi:FkbM family methyltransferase
MTPNLATPATKSFARLLTPGSLVRYLLWRLGGRRDAVALRLAKGPVILLRPPGAANNDYGVAYEIFVYRYYHCPRPLPAASIGRIVDLGANVGFSCLYWLTRFPKAEVIALEPHPSHFAQCRANLAANGMLPRVELHQAAAGAAPQRIMLSDAGTSSSVVADAADGIAAEMLDVFALLDGRRVDLMKLDIEGGEYAILDDPRFAALQVPYLVMEWHGGPADRDRCLSRFSALDYETLELFDSGSYGMLWAFRREPAVAG